MSMAILNDDDTRWRCVQSRTPSTSFVYAVKTTKIFCRPDCPARLARRANVAFFDRGSEAQKSGFRACKRCKPDLNSRQVVAVAPTNPSPSTGLPKPESTGPDEDPSLAPGEQNAKRRAATKAKRVLEASQGKKPWRQVAQEVGLSPRYLFEAFKAIEGVTPGVYSESIRRKTSKSPKLEVMNGSEDATTLAGESLRHHGNANSALTNGEFDFDSSWDNFTSDEINHYILSLGSNTNEGSSRPIDSISWVANETCSTDSDTTANTPVQDSILDEDVSEPVDPFTWPLDPQLDMPEDMLSKYLFDGDWTNVSIEKEQSSLWD